MKVLSIKQPWASLILNGYKCYEFRSWRTKYRGELYIHASKSYEKDAMEHFKCLNLEYPTGCIIGKVNLDDIVTVTEDFENNLIKENELVYGFSKGRAGYAWKISNPEFVKQIPVNGRLNIWEYEKK